MNEGVAAVLAAVIAVAGVGLGLFGARWQYRAALEQANAAVRAANAQAQAAIEAVKAQGRDQNTQWRRTLRRDVWVSFIAALDALEDAAREVTDLAVRDDFQGAVEAMSAVRQRWDELHRPIGSIELEGPEVIFDKALSVRSVYQSAMTDTDRDMKERAALQRLEELQDAGNTNADRFFELVSQLSGSAPSTAADRRIRAQIRALDIDIPRPEIHRALNFAARRAPANIFSPWGRAERQRRAFVAAAREHLDGE